MSTSYRCVCDDWRVNLPILNAPLMLAVARNPNAGHGYKGKPFAFCPWCGLTLRVSATETVLPDAPEPPVKACPSCNNERRVALYTVDTGRKVGELACPACGKEGR